MSIFRNNVATGQRDPFARRAGDWMLTSTGRVYYPIDPRAEEVHIKDIAHSLSMQCRYGGHASRFYSVAEHSLHMAAVLQRNGADTDTLLQALLHDATEAYVADVPRPLKPFLANYADIEARNRRVIATAFGIEYELPAVVEDLDRRMCLAEMRQLMPMSPVPLGIPGAEPDVWIRCLDPADAETWFLKVFHYLWSKRLHTRSKTAHPAAYPTQEKK